MIAIADYGVGNIFSLNSNSKCIKSLLEIHRRASLGLISDSFTGERLVFDFLCKLCSCLFNNEDGFSDIVRKAKQIIGISMRRVFITIAMAVFS